MTVRFDDVNSAAGIERILVLAVGGGQGLALAVVAAS